MKKNGETIIKYYDSIYDNYTKIYITTDYLIPIKKFLCIYANERGYSVEDMFGRITFNSAKYDNYLE